MGPNQCAGSLPELGVIVNDRQWVISEAPQLPSWAARPCPPGVMVWVPGTVVWVLPWEASVVRRRLSRLSGRVLIVFRRSIDASHWDDESPSLTANVTGQQTCPVLASSRQWHGLETDDVVIPCQRQTAMFPCGVGVP